MSIFTSQWLPGSKQDVRILQLTGPFTLAAVFDFQAEIRKDPPRVLILDLTGVPYMDSAALGSVLGLHVSCQKEGRYYAMVGVSDRLKTLFKVCGVDGLLSIYPSVAEAEAGLGK
ncbi:MAG: STAS domain-containing protein [Bryobacteraceae bacterium]|jgi:anti-anti-sigma factor